MKTIVIDFEMCIVEKESRKAYPYKNEIIQIGAALLDEEFRIADQFNCFVKPQYGELTRSIRRLTGIRPQDLADAPKIAEALKLFSSWLPKEDVTVVAWSDNDERQLRQEMGAKAIRNERVWKLFDNWLDCQPMFSEKLNTGRIYNLEEALIASDVVTEGRAHNGLVDAVNTALLYAKMMTEKDFRLNPYYDIAHNDKETAFGLSLGDIFANLDFDLDTLQAVSA